ncbi:MAG: MATE family efflux transporter [Lachnospiraceae bacterium]|nr:MATE family efflux transporter [Lachnospiraceae bacterium]
MNKDMTTGSPTGILWRFVIPMLVSTMFQQIYNIVDSIVVGKYVGVDALAAVGASYPITMIFMAVAMGCNIGCSVVISQFFGAKDYGNLKTSVSTSLISTVGVSAFFMVIGFVFCNAFLRLLGTPENIMGDSAIYLGIYVGGLLFLFLYNICTGIFTALGDSKTPLYFLIGSSVGNVILDLVFVINFHMGVAGVAWATFIAQGISSVLAFAALLRRMHGIEAKKGYEKFSGKMLLRISRIAIPSILQQSFVSVGNVFVQGLVNSFGSDVVAGYSAAIKLNTFTITSVSTLGNGISNFTAQNIGAGKIERVKKGLGVGMRMMLLVAIPFTIAYFFFGNAMMGIFMNTGDVAARQVGITFLRIASPFYVAVSAKLICDGVLRGAGAMKYFMITTFSDLIIRVVLAFILSGFFGSDGIWLSWPFGWIIGALLSAGFYKAGVWHKGMRVR